MVMLFARAYGEDAIGQKALFARKHTRYQRVVLADIIRQCLQFQCLEILIITSIQHCGALYITSVLRSRDLRNNFTVFIPRSSRG